MSHHLDFLLSLFQSLPFATLVVAKESETGELGWVSNARDWLPENWQPTWDALQSVPFLAPALIILLGWLVAKTIQWLVVRSLGSLSRRTHTQVDDQIVAIIKRPLFLTVFLFFAGVASKSVGLPPGAERIILKILLSAVILVWTSAAFGLLHILLQTLSRNRHKYRFITRKTLPLFELVGKIIVVAFSAYALMLIWGINPTAWLASAGIIGMAVGFAAKDSLANLFGGIFVIADAPYKVGDFVQLDSGERGMVTQIGLRSTRILSRDDIEITVPNAVMANSKIINENGGRWEKERIRAKVGVAYGSDVDHVCAVLLDIANETEGLCEHPEPRVRMRGFGASSLDFELLGWITEPVLRGRILHALYMNIYKRFAAEDIEIPYSKHDVYIKEMPASAPPRTPPVDSQPYHED